MAEMQGERVSGLGGPTRWVANKHGIKSAWPEEYAKHLVATRVGYIFCEPEFVPEFKEYPDDIELTESGKRRRDQLRKNRRDQDVIQHKMKAVIEDISTADEIRAKAKAEGIKHYWTKSIDNLKEELKTLAETPANEVKFDVTKVEDEDEA